MTHIAHQPTKAFLKLHSIEAKKEFSEQMSLVIRTLLDKRRNNSTLRWLVWNRTWFYSTRDNKPRPLAFDTKYMDKYAEDILILRPIGVSNYFLIPLSTLLFFHIHNTPYIETLEYSLNRLSPERLGVVYPNKKG